MGYLVNLLGPQLELGVQLLTFRTPLPNATERQLVHDNPPTNSFDGMQPMSYTAGRTSTLPWQPTSTTVGEAADAGLAASAAPVTAPPAAMIPAATMPRTRMTFIGCLLPLIPLSNKTPSLHQPLKPPVSPPPIRP